jgi:hexosaminidase
MTAQAVMRRWLGLLCLALALAVPALARSAPTPYALQWEVERSVFGPGVDEARSSALLSLTNHSAQPLPARGWALYFTCLAGVVTGPAEPHVVFEQVVGTLYRMRPAEGFAEVAPGDTLRVSVLHHELMFKLDKAPQGPYLVFDEQPDTGVAITDFRLLTPTRPEQLAVPAGERSPLVTAEEIFRRNAGITQLPPSALPPVFPTPQRAVPRRGLLELGAAPMIRAPAALAFEAEQARALLAPHFDGQAAKRGAPVLQLAVTKLPGRRSPEAYELHIEPGRGIRILGNSAAGVAHGLQSLRDLLPLQPQPGQPVELKALRLADAPRFAYRGLLLDVARNFQSKETVLALLDLMARYKLNKLHLHLTDDEGWRLEIEGLPELTDVGGRRGHSADPDRHLPPAHGSGPDVNDAHGSGHYSRADYIAILRHAAARHIEVIPEIEMPGHARAAVKAMEARARRLRQLGDPSAERFLLSDPRDASHYRSAQLHTDNLVNPGMPGAYAFVEHVVQALVALHREAGVPLATLHLGADELPQGAWQGSPAAQAVIQAQDLGDTAGLWNAWYDRVQRLVTRHGIRVAGWEELGAMRARLAGQDKLVPNPHFAGRGFTLFVWNDIDGAEDLAYRLANAGYDTVLAPATALYFDMAHNRSPEERGVNWAAFVDLDTVFDFVPFDSLRLGATRRDPDPAKVQLAPEARKRIRGLEATLFTETVREPAHMEFMLLPRLLALAERAWAADPAWASEADVARAERLHRQAWNVFVNQLGRQVLPRLDRERPGLNYRIPPPGLARVNGEMRINHQLPGFVLRYTTDGSEPGAASPLAHDTLPAGSVVRAAAFASNGRRGAISSIDAR